MSGATGAAAVSGTAGTTGAWPSGLALAVSSGFVGLFLVSAKLPLSFFSESESDRNNSDGRADSAPLGELRVIFQTPSTFLVTFDADAGRSPCTQTSSILDLSSQRSPLQTRRFAQAPDLMTPHSSSIPRSFAGLVVTASKALSLSSPRLMAFRI